MTQADTLSHRLNSAVLNRSLRGCSFFPRISASFSRSFALLSPQTPSLPGPGPGHDAARENQIPFREEGYELAGFVWLQGFNDPVDGTTYPGPNNGGYHYFGSAKIFAQMGKALAEAMLPFQKLTRKNPLMKMHPASHLTPRLAAMLCAVAALLAPASVAADEETYKSVVMPFLNTYCTSCHGATKSKGDVTLNEISADLAAGKDIDLWNSVLNQLVLSEMPPAKEKKQPTASEINKVVDWINAELNKSGNVAGLYHKLESPNYGNLVNHQKLFSGEIKTKPFSPARLWRMSEKVFDNVKSNYGVDISNIRQPFLLDDKKGIRDYANLLFADSAVVDVLMANAGYCVDQLMKKDRTISDIATGSPTPDQLRTAVSQHFKRVVFRDPTQDEIDKYLGLYQGSLQEGGNAEALRVMLMAVMLHPESVYRLEIGLGSEDSFGRRLLSPTELAYSIAYALTDGLPDGTLLQAAESGKLKTKDDVHEQVSRILADESIDKPRILRFFQEFFGYNQAHKIFKDEGRSGGFHYYGENYPRIYERDADFFVMNILDIDKDVFRQLLLSDEYFILNRQTFRNNVYDFYQRNKPLIDSGKITGGKTRELLESLGLKNWGELNLKYYLHGFDRGFSGSAGEIKDMANAVSTDQPRSTSKEISQAMHPLYSKYPMVYDLGDDEQNFLLPQPYKRPNRAGILTHPAWLIAYSLNDHTDPIRRGKWVRERLLAGVVLDVPITVDATIPVDHHKTLRERLSVTEKQECWRCHEKMNPLGHPFEVYDDFGRYRTEELLDKLPKVNEKYPSKPVNATGVITGTGEKGVDGEVKDALELIKKLANSHRVRQSIIRHVFRYYMARNEILSDSVTLIAADKAYLESDGSFKALLVSLLTSDSFLYRKTL
jgi:mono/diheme cytochrome c family protein